MSKMYSTANLSDKELKEQGNRLFSLHKYEDAANCYTKAIVSIDINLQFIKNILGGLIITIHKIADKKSNAGSLLY